MSYEEEFFGVTSVKPEYDEYHNSQFNWVVLNPEMSAKGEREIEDGDFLEIFDNLGNHLLKKTITRDYKSYYNSQYQRQLHNGMAIKWAPEGIALDYWISIFNRGSRARLLKKGK